MLDLNGDLMLDALQRVVHGLHATTKLLCDLLIGVPFDVKPQDVALKRRQRAHEAMSDGLGFPSGYDDIGGVADSTRRKDFFKYAFAAALRTQRAAERDVGVKRRVLLTRGGFDGGDELPGDTELGEGTETGTAGWIVVSNSLAQADEPLLEHIVTIRAGEEICTALAPNERPIPHHEFSGRTFIPRLSSGDEFQIIRTAYGSVSTVCATDLQCRSPQSVPPDTWGRKRCNRTL